MRSASKTGATPVARNRWVDSEDERLTAPERQYLRQLVLRLKNGGPAQPVRDRLIAGERGQQIDLEQAIAALFTGRK